MTAAWKEMKNMEFPTYRTGNLVEPGDYVALLPSIIEAVPIDYIKRQRWFGSKMKGIKHIHLYDAALVSCNLPVYVMMLIELLYDNEDSEIYYFPVVIQSPDSPTGKLPVISEDVILELQTPISNLLVLNALQDEEFLRKHLQMVEVSERIDSMAGHFNCTATALLTASRDEQSPLAVNSVRFMGVEQSNTSVIYDEAFVMKNFRRLANGTNPDLEIPLFLTTMTNFKNMPLVAGYIEYSGKGDFKSTIASLQNFIVSQGDGWKYTLGHLHNFYDFILKDESRLSAEDKATPEMKELVVRQFSNTYLQDAFHLGEITGELHNALASNCGIDDFSPELIEESDMRIWIKSIQSYTSEVLHILNDKCNLFPLHIQEQIKQVLTNDLMYLNKAGDLVVLADERTHKIRYHGDYHLGQVLKTVSDWIIIDFEGELARTLKERRAKNSPLKDVAGMLRSFNYAVYSKLFDFNLLQKNRFNEMEKWGRIWEGQVCKDFLKGYFSVSLNGSTSYLPASREATQKALTAFQLEKAIYELNYELNNRPTWIEIPLKYLLSLSNEATNNVI